MPKPTWRGGREYEGEQAIDACTRQTAQRIEGLPARRRAEWEVCSRGTHAYEARKPARPWRRRGQRHARVDEEATATTA